LLSFAFRIVASLENILIIPEEYTMPKVTVDIPQELYDDMMAHVGRDKKFVNASDAIRTAIRKMLDQLDEIDRRRGRLKEAERCER
jgi:Arc/MetJ-type ribon-helix-helix transcriptional regulator